MPGPIRTRLSCDRCHAQKLKCPKTPGTSVCTRCAKIGAVCTFSQVGGGSAASFLPPTPTPTPAFPSASAGDAMDPLDTSMAWPFAYDGLSFDALMQVPTPASSDKANPDTDGRPSCQPTASQAPPSDPPTTEPASCAQRLAKLLADTDALLSMMPNELEFHVPVDRFEQAAAAFTLNYGKAELVEQLFSTTQRLIDIYPEAVKVSLSPGSSRAEPCRSSTCIHHHSLPPGLAAVEAAFEVRRSRFRLDISVANLVISCHLRLLDILDTLFLCVMSCSRFTSQSPHQTEPEFTVPDLRVGSFVPSKASTVLMQAVLLRHLASSLSGCVRHFSTSLAGITNGQSDREAQMLSLQSDLLTERHEAMVTQIEALGSSLIAITSLG